MDLIRHLRYFVAVAEEEHFGHAADELGMTQPPVSQGIQRLERRWDLRLFDRSARRVRLTEVGAALLPAARHVLEAAEDADREAAQLAEAVRPRTVGLIPELGGLVGLYLARVAHGVGAETVVVPSIVTSAAAADLVAGGELDLAVVQHPAVLDGLVLGPVHAVERTLAVGRSSEAEHVREVSVPVALPPRGGNPPAHDQLVDELRRAGHRGDVRMTSSVAEAVALTAAGATCLVHPIADLPTWLRAVDGGRLDLRLRLVTPRLAGPDPVTTRLREIMEGHLDQLRQ